MNKVKKSGSEPIEMQGLEEKQMDVNKSSKLTKEKFENLVKEYKKKNPVKYASKKEALEKKLASL